MCALSLIVTPAFGMSSKPQEWHRENGHSWAVLNVPRAGATGFKALASSETGIVFTNKLTESSIAANRVLGNGSGVAAGDYDRDGLPDLYFCGLESGNVLYRNLGNWRFQDTTAEAGVGRPQTLCRGAVFADLNGDDFPDLLVSTLNEGVLCFLNNRQGRFVDHTAAAGTRSGFGSMTLALADVDGNGTLDLYVANNRPSDIRDRGRVNIQVVAGKLRMPAEFKDRLTVRDGQILEFGQPDQLLLNDGTGKFRAVSWSSGTFLNHAGQPLTEAPLDWGLTATFRDVNNDLEPDLYVCNDYWTLDHLWINDGHGRFREIGMTDLRPICSSSMGVDFADLDRDGQVDLFVADMLSRDPRLRKRQMFAEKVASTPPGVTEDRPQVMRNTLFRNQGNGSFSELANYAGLIASDWSWSPIFLDVDLDGYEDLVISAGHFRDVQDLDAVAEIRRRQHPWTGFKSEADRQKAYTRELLEHYRFYPTLEMPIVTFRNQRNWTFEETTATWGLNDRAVHQGSALADLDRDGDLDLVVNILNGAAGLYRNESNASRVAVKLKGRAPNTQGIGAKITLLNGATSMQSTEIVCGGRYLSGSQPLAVFAAGAAKSNMSIVVAWRNGGTSSIEGVQANRIYEIFENADPRPGEREERLERLERPSAGTSTLPPSDAPNAPNAPRSNAPHAPRSPAPLFEDLSASLSHTHHEIEFNDFERQPLLPFKLSQGGPGLAWFDIDADGRDELVIGSGSGGVPAVYRSNSPGKFSRIEPALSPASASDFSGLLGWVDETGARSLVAGLTGYEAPNPHAAIQFRYRSGQFEKGEPLAAEMPSGSALALGDMNGNGQLVLFVAGNVVPGRYPTGAPSKIYRRQQGTWQLDNRNSVLLDNLGIVNGAVWSDLDNDGRAELVLACEWGPIRVFASRSGQLFEATSEWGLAEHKGWWKGLTTGDLDGDGKLDIVAANWGLNSPYTASAERPLTFYYGELAQPKVVDILETEYDATTGALTPRRQFFALAQSLPFLFDHFSSHRAYSEAKLDQVLGERRLLARTVEATTLATTAFLNRGDRFDAVPLPRQAQLAPAFSVNIADFDGDGHEDVFLSQNFFATQPETPRLAAGRGLWLRGNGRGGLTPVSSQESGIGIDGEQRGAAAGDFDEDGRTDLAVSQNGAATKLFRNTGARPGLRVKLVGPAGNASAYGAALRLITDQGSGPVREIHGGSGYLSQDSATQVLSSAGQPKSLWVRWPGGRETTTPIPPQSRELAVNAQGAVLATK